MIMTMDGCIFTYILFMGRLIIFGWFNNYGATFGKMHTVEGGIVACDIFFIGGVGDVWHFVTEERRGGEIWSKKGDIFSEWLPSGLPVEVLLQLMPVQMSRRVGEIRDDTLKDSLQNGGVAVSDSNGVDTQSQNDGSRAQSTKSLASTPTTAADDSTHS